MSSEHEDEWTKTYGKFYSVGSGPAASRSGSGPRPPCSDFDNDAEAQRYYEANKLCVKGGKKRRSAKRRRSVKGKKRGGRGRKSRKC